jgi:hypothetical protein
VRNKLEHKTRPDRMLLPERISEADSLNFECSPPHQELDCIAAIPAGGGILARALITSDEKAKKIPAAKPQQSDAINVNAGSKRSIIAESIWGLIQPRRSPINGELSERSGLPAKQLPCRIGHFTAKP